MKKFASSVLAAVTVFAATIPVANAQSTAARTFTVSATLTAFCTIDAFNGPIAFGTVQAFSAPVTPVVTATALVKCTRGSAAPSMVFDAAPGGGGTGSTSLAGPTPTGAGVLPNGLFYTLGAAFGTTAAGSAPTTAGLATRDADERILTVTGTMGAQAGGNLTGAASHVRTMTIAF